MRYMFANCELDTQLRAVRCGATQRLLRPKPFQVLLYLLENRDRVVSKQELAERLWPDPYISDTVIENSILAARRAVGDSGRTQRIIQTLHGHGYRFIVPVTIAGDTADTGAPASISCYAELAFEVIAARAGKNEKIFSRSLISHTLRRTLT